MTNVTEVNMTIVVKIAADHLHNDMYYYYDEAEHTIGEVEADWVDALNSDIVDCTIYTE